jgi:hypothetical protein
MHRHADISLPSLVAEARRLSFNVTQGLLFSLFCNCLLAAILFGGQIALLPPIFNGFQVRWRHSRSLLTPAIPIRD